MAQIYYDKDVKKDALSGRTVAVLGFGSQGHAHALNLKDSHVKVIVGLKKGSKSWRIAERQGLRVYETGKAVKRADVVASLVPDQNQKEVYEHDIEPNLTRKGTLLYAHGFTIHYHVVVPRQDLDVVMVAPKGPGHLVREVYEKGEGVPSLLAVHQDASGKAKEITLSYGKALGATRAGLIETSFAEETETDLFGEQTTLCGGIVYLMKSAFEVLVEAGYQPEIAYFEVMHEMKLIVDLMYQGGFSYMLYSVSDTAEHGCYSAGPKVLDEHVKENMKKILRRVQDGSYATEWILENKAGRPHFLAMRKKMRSHQIEEVGRKLRKMMPFIQEKEVE